MKRNRGFRDHSTGWRTVLRDVHRHTVWPGVSLRLQHSHGTSFRSSSRTRLQPFRSTSFPRAKLNELRRRKKSLPGSTATSRTNSRMLSRPSQFEGLTGAKPFRISEGYPRVFTTEKGGGDLFWRDLGGLDPGRRLRGECDPSLVQ